MNPSTVILVMLGIYGIIAAAAAVILPPTTPAGPRHRQPCDHCRRLNDLLRRLPKENA